MSTQANVEDVEALKRLKVALAKFAETLGNAVADAASDVQRTLNWLELEQGLKWKSEQRKRHLVHQQALEKLRMKQLYKGPTGERQSDVDEQVAVKKAKAALEEAEMKIRAVDRHRNQLSRDAVLFQGALSRLSGIAHQSAPAAMAELTNMMVALEKYGKLAVEEVVSEAGGGGGEIARVEQGEQGMGRGGVGGGAGSGVMQGGGEEEKVEVKVDWAEVVKRARAQWKRMGGVVVMEEGAGGEKMGGVMVVVKDGFSGRIFVGGVTSVEGVGLKSMTKEEFLNGFGDGRGGIEEVLGLPGERRFAIESGMVAARG